MQQTSLVKPSLSALPAVAVAVAFALGIAAATALYEAAGWWPGVAAAVTAAATLFVRRLGRWPMLLLFASTGYIDASLSLDTEPVPEGEHVVTADVTSASASNPLTATLTLRRIDGRDCAPSVIRAYAEEAYLFEPGMRLMFRTVLRLPTPPAIPDIREDSHAASCVVKRTTEVTSSPAPGFMAAMRRLRTAMLDRLYLSPLSPASKEFVAAALLGERSVIGPDTREAFSRAGVSHILSLSGLHVAIVAAIFYWLLAPLALCLPHHVRLLTLLAAVWLYACLTGLGTPVVRAAIMVSAALAGELLQRRTVALNSLCAAALVILLFSPGQLFDVGFQLSFAAVAGILLFAPSLSPFAGQRSALLRSAGSALGVSVAAMLGAGMVAAVWFHSFPILFLGANMLVVPLVVPAILGGGIIVIAAQSAGVGCGPVAWAVDRLVDFTLTVSEVIGELPHATVDTWPLSTLTMGLFLIFLLLTGTALWRNGRPGRVITAVAVMTAVATVITGCLTTGMKPHDAEGSWYVAPVSNSTTLLIPVGGRLFMVTDAPTATHPGLRQHLHELLSDYMGYRGIDSITVALDTVRTAGFERSGNRLTVGQRRIVLLDGSDGWRGHEPGATVIVTRLFNGDIEAVAEELSPDRVLLSRCLHPRLMRRYKAELAELETDARIIP